MAVLNIEDYIKQGVIAVDVHEGSTEVEQQNVIRLRKEAYSAILASKEMLRAIEKRFKGKKTAYGEPSHIDIVGWCMASNNYGVCETNIGDISDADVERVWEFLDTISVSSSEQCRSMVAEFKGARSAVGFRSERSRALRGTSSAAPHRLGDTGYAWSLGALDSGGRCKETGERGIHGTPAAASRGTQTRGRGPPASARGRGGRGRLLRGSVPPVVSVAPAAQHTGHETIEDLLAEECMEWVKVSPDPCASALHFRSRLLKLD